MGLCRRYTTMCKFDVQYYFFSLKKILELGSLFLRKILLNPAPSSSVLPFWDFLFHLLFPKCNLFCFRFKQCYNYSLCQCVYCHLPPRLIYFPPLAVATGMLGKICLLSTGLLVTAHTVMTVAFGDAVIVTYLVVRTIR